MFALICGFLVLVYELLLFGKPLVLKMSLLQFADDVFDVLISLYLLSFDWAMLIFFFFFSLFFSIFGRYVSGYKNRFQNFIKNLREMGDEVLLPFKQKQYKL